MLPVNTSSFMRLLVFCGGVPPGLWRGNALAAERSRCSPVLGSPIVSEPTGLAGTHRSALLVSLCGGSRHRTRTDLVGPWVTRHGFGRGLRLFSSVARTPSPPGPDTGRLGGGEGGKRQHVTGVYPFFTTRAKPPEAPPPFGAPSQGVRPLPLPRGQTNPHFWPET